MASISSTRSSSSANSIYGTRNVISGLASGLDTETLIENAVSGYQNKINALNQQRTKVEWQQEAYRSIVTKMAGFSSKYADYQSSSNLMSTSFFNQAVQTVTQGANKDLISATGKTGSNVSINGVRQLATSARYSVSTRNLGGVTGGSGNGTTATAGVLNMDDLRTSLLSGTMNLKYGGTTLSLSFKESQVFDSAQDLVDEINKQLKDQTISFSGGTSAAASERVKAELNANNEIVFKEIKGNNGIYISSASDSIKEAFGLEPGEGVKSLAVKKDYDGGDVLSKRVGNVIDYFSDSPLTITLDGVTKTIKMPTAEEVAGKISDPALAEKIKDQNSTELTDPAERQARDDAYIALIQERIDSAFGKGKLTVSDALNDKDGDEKGLQLQFKTKEGSTFQIKSDKGEYMDLSTNGLTSYLDTSTTLEKLGILDDLKAVQVEKKDADGNVMKDADGNTIYEDKLDEDGNKLYSLEVNGVEIGEFTKDTTLGTIISKISGNKEAGVTASYSKLTNEFTFTAKDSGVAGKVEFGEGLAQKLFGKGIPDGDLEADANFEKKEDAYGNVTYVNKESGVEITKGQDAIFTATINGKQMEMTRSSNIVEMDGLTVTLKGSFGYLTDDDGNFVDKEGNKVDEPVLDARSEPVTFKSSADADKIVNAIKAMVEDYNAMVTEIKNTYSTLPAQRSSGVYYQPLTDDDKDGMSESAIEAWEEKAKQGILFGDNDLSSLYSRLTKAISMAGQNGADLKAAGITLNYSNGLTTLSFNENQLRETLETDPDRVTEIFTKSKSNGAESDGIMAALKEPLDLYGKTTGVNLTTGSKGVLVAKAGHPLAPSTMYSNTIQSQLDKIDDQISAWQEKMSDQVDYYTTQFSKLEQLVSQMNSQSSALSQMMGGY